MVKEILVYPDKKIHTISPDLREFDDELFKLLQDMKDTMIENNIDALAAIQIGVSKAVVLLRDDNGDFLEIINPREMSKKGKIISRESTLYYPNTTMDVPRFNKIKITYQDRNGETHFLSAEGERAITLQRKIDYVFGGTVANRMHTKVRNVFESKLDQEYDLYDSCPTEVLKRDYIKSFMSKLLFLEFLTLFARVFDFSDSTLQSFYSFDIFVSISMIFLLIAYAVVGYHESKIYTNCSSCQMGYVITNLLLYLGMASVFFIASRYFILG